MQISGKCKIANKFIDNKLSEQFDFENKGKLGVGRLTWSDVVKDKDGGKPTFVNSTKKFICFGGNIDFIEQNLGQFFEIVGNLKTEQFKGNDDKMVKYDQIVINEVRLAEKKVDSHNAAKADGYVKETDDFCPF